MDKHYFIIWSASPDLLITKLPEKGVRWRSVMKAMTAVARMYGIFRKELSLLEGIHAGQDGYQNITDIFTTQDKSRLPKFDLWAWRGDKFIIVRERDPMRNPPKLDRVVVRYAERVYNDLVEAINSGKLKGKPLYVSPPGVIATREEWQYDLQWEDRKIDLIVDSRSQGGATFAPDDKKQPIKIVVKGWKTPSKSMFIHEFAHYLQSKHGLLDRVEQRRTVAEYLDSSNERDAYFIQFLAEDVVPKLKGLKKMPDRERAAEIFQKQFGTKKAMAARVAKYFRASGHWKEMMPQTQKHHIDRLCEFIRGS